MKPAGRIRLLHQVARAADVTPSQAERRLQDAEKVVYHSSRIKRSSTTFGPVGRILATVLALLPASALAVHSFLNRGQPTVVVEVVLAVVPAFAFALLVLRDVWQVSKQPERVVVADRLGRTRP